MASPSIALCLGGAPEDRDWHRNYLPHVLNHAIDSSIACPLSALCHVLSADTRDANSAVPSGSTTVTVPVLARCGVEGARGVVEKAMDAHDELTLAEHAARGDHAAFGALVRAYEPLLLAYLVQMLGNPKAARDTAQETFLAAFQALPRWRPPDAARADPSRPLSPWLYRIATNKALSLLRSGSGRLAIVATMRTSAGYSSTKVMTTR